MSPLRRRINPQTFVITLSQIAKHLGINPKRILNWEKWDHVLWVHIKGKGGHFVSYRKLEQWIAACRLVIHSCRDLSSLNLIWSAIKREAKRYTIEALIRLQSIWRERYTYLSSQT
ncbi:MAG: hypothetical protein F6K10_27820 [Moorea sp. SIO2B7]|nr:hypothetical protein [Moorena sp. SIO2B7]